MLINYIRIAVRNLKKHKAFSLINISGLSIGITSCIFIFLYVQNEMSYDKFNKNADQIYRVVLHAVINNAKFNAALTSAPLGEELYHDYPEVTAYTRIRHFGSPLVRYNDKVFSEKHFLFADSTFFNVFSPQFIEGNPKTALSQPNTVVITESTAKKYFGNQNPMGKILNLDHTKNFLVTGVLHDVPTNSHFHFDFLGSISSYSESRDQNWISNDYYTYIILRKGTNLKSFSTDLKNVVQKYVAPQITSAIGVSWEKMQNMGNKWAYVLQPLTSIHLYSHLEGEIEPNGDITDVYIFSAIALLILLIACINFMNLSTARSEKRAMEVGIRKTLGSNKAQLVRQFFMESIIMSFIAVTAALSLVEILLPVFNDVAEQNIKLGVLTNLYVIPLLICFAIVVGLLAGSYPAFYLASFEPAHILKKDNSKSSRKSWLRSILVIFQFSVSIILFIGTLIIYNQMSYIQNKKLGFDKGHIIVINKADDIGTQIQSFKNELLSDPKIISVSNSTAIPGKRFSSTGCRIGGTGGSQTRILNFLNTDFNFVKTFRIKMAAGRYFSKVHPSDTSAVVINQATVRAFGIKNLVGKNLFMVIGPKGQQIAYRIIGVTNDFNYESLHQEVRPLAILLFSNSEFGRFISVRIAAGNYPAALTFMKNTWNKFAGKEAFDYNFFNQDLDHLYIAEQRASRIFSIFSVLAILIACLGLLGLTSFVTEQRTKEIGIRKVLGASISEIVFLLAKEFAKWVLIANIIAWPVAYYVMNNWLSNFAYRIHLGIGIFLLSGAIALMIAIITVSTHTIKAAIADPIKSLRYE